MPKKSKRTKKSTKKKVMSGAEHTGFIAILMLFVGFSLYGIFYFYNSTSLYLNTFKASVIEGDAISGDYEVDDEVAYDDESENDDGAVPEIPSECTTCPRIPVCQPFCEYTELVLDQSERYEIFTDVWSDHTYALPIETLYKLGIIKGYDDGSFKPDQTLNRAELLTIITNAVDADFSGASYDYCFSDVTNQWFAVYVCYAKTHGWVAGYADGTYKPGDTIDKAAALKITMEAFGYEPAETVTTPPMSDVPVDSWYAPYVVTALDAGIISNNPTFNASHQITRAEIVKTVYNAMAF
ncbi:hypothetical protein GF354_02745 [Candidatus Peregrinibacteria bacterium]|nr:hypothetical protein [Candidatus Peregrinibacteria bacterium]